MDTLLATSSINLKDGTYATIYPVWEGSHLPLELIASLCVEYNLEIDKGESFASTQRFMLDGFEKYWFSGVSGVVIKGDARSTEDFDLLDPQECLGTFSIHPAFPGRSSHICTVNILVKSKFRNQNLGFQLGNCFLDWAMRLGYNYAYIPLVYSTNTPACKILENLSFKRLAVLEGAGILKGYALPVNGYIYGRSIPPPSLDFDLELYGGSYDDVITESPTKNPNNSNTNTNMNAKVHMQPFESTEPSQSSDLFQRIYDHGIQEYENFMNVKNYLESGKYPINLTNTEKTRIRSRSRSYILENGRLKYKRSGTLVVMHPKDQIELTSGLHSSNHNGINKMQTVINERYYWSRVRDTIQYVIQSCDVCKGTSKESYDANTGRGGIHAKPTTQASTKSGTNINTQDQSYPQLQTPPPQTQSHAPLHAPLTSPVHKPLASPQHLHPGTIGSNADLDMMSANSHLQDIYSEDYETIEDENEAAMNLFDNIVYLPPENEDDEYVPEDEDDNQFI